MPKSEVLGSPSSPLRTPKCAAAFIIGDALRELRKLPDASVNCCVTSPPYWGLRDYGVPGQLGLERTPAEYVARMVELFREVRRVLRDDGTLWLNLGDSYAHNGPCGGGSPVAKRDHAGLDQEPYRMTDKAKQKQMAYRVPPGLKPKDLVGIPWRVAFALQADGWYLRSDIIWHKPNPMPESVTDRPTKAHEYLFLLTKSERYWYDAAAVRENRQTAGNRYVGARYKGRVGGHGTSGSLQRYEASGLQPSATEGRNRRTVWNIATKPYAGAHFATFPPALIEPCILAGCSAGGTVLDPFAGAGTTALVAQKHGRNSIGIELNPEYVRMAKARVAAGKLAQMPPPSRPLQTATRARIQQLRRAA
jgi:DNA modification methylase